MKPPAKRRAAKAPQQGASAVVARRYPTQPVGVELDAIVAAALRLIDAEGVDKLTMRRLSAELSISAPALYWHFPDREALLDAVAELVVGREPLARSQGGDWRDDLRACLDDLRRRLLRHPNAVILFTAPRRQMQAVLPAVKRILELLQDAGLEGGDLISSMQVLFVHLVGSVFVQTFVVQGLALPWRDGAAAERALDALLATGSEYSDVASMLREHAYSLTFGDMFRRTADLLIADAEARAAA